MARTLAIAAAAYALAASGVNGQSSAPAYGQVRPRALRNCCITLKLKCLVRRTGLDRADDLCIGLHMPSDQPMVFSMCARKRPCSNLQHLHANSYSYTDSDSYLKQPNRNLLSTPGSERCSHSR